MIDVGVVKHAETLLDQAGLRIATTEPDTSPDGWALQEALYHMNRAKSFLMQITRRGGHEPK